MREVLYCDAGPSIAAVAVDRPIMAVARCLLGHDEGYRTSRALACRVATNLVDRATAGGSAVESMSYVSSNFSSWRTSLGPEAAEAQVVAGIGLRAENEWQFSHVGNCEVIAVRGSRTKRVIQPHTLWDDQFPNLEPELPEDVSAAEIASRAIGWEDSKAASTRLACSDDELIVMASVPVFRQVSQSLTANPLDAYTRVKKLIDRWSGGHSLVVYWEDRQVRK